MMQYDIKDLELGATVSVKAQGVAEAMFEYLPWPSLDLIVTFKNSAGWLVIDRKTDFQYEVSTNPTE